MMLYVDKMFLFLFQGNFVKLLVYIKSFLYLTNRKASTTTTVLSRLHKVCLVHVQIFMNLFELYLVLHTPHYWLTYKFRPLVGSVRGSADHPVTPDYCNSPEQNNTTDTKQASKCRRVRSTELGLIKIRRSSSHLWALAQLASTPS